MPPFYFAMIKPCGSRRTAFFQMNGTYAAMNKVFSLLFSKERKAEKVAFYGRLPFVCCTVALSFQNKVMWSSSLHQSETERAVYNVVYDYAEKIEFENFVENKLAAYGLHNLGTAVFLAFRLRHNFYLQLH